ncbi:MAG: TIGR00159 family protein [Ruminococcaceae bacterium]|nr:TIGR00159 family protein [Oscillospiraceae bacterium]
MYAKLDAFTIENSEGDRAMNVIEDMLQQVTKMQWSDYLDIVIVAFLLYKLLPLIRSTGAMRIAKTIVVIIVLAWVTGLLELYAISYILNQFLQIGVIAVVILFQPEIRRTLDHLGSMKIKKFFGTDRAEPEMAPVVAQTVKACEVMSREKVGALIVFARDNRLDEYFKTGTMIDAQVSEQLLRNVFFPKAALHDGAMIIRDGRVAAAGCVLPLSDSNRLNADLGTRHRAGVGMSEVSDAVVVIVSEETGTISVALGGMLKRHLAPQTLERLLLHELCPEQEQRPDNLSERLRQKLQKSKEERK